MGAQPKALCTSRIPEPGSDLTAPLGKLPVLVPAPVHLQALMAAGCAPAQNPVGILRLSGHPVPVPHTPTVQDFFPSRGPHTLGRESMEVPGKKEQGREGSGGN